MQPKKYFGIIGYKTQAIKIACYLNFSRSFIQIARQFIDLRLITDNSEVYYTEGVLLFNNFLNRMIHAIADMDKIQTFRQRQGIQL
jgi:hypothetical protein